MHAQPNPLRGPLTSLASLAVVCAAALLLSGCDEARHLSFLNPQGPIAAAQRTHLIEVVLGVLVAVLPVLFLAPWMAWRYRLRSKTANTKKVRYAPDWAFSWWLELPAWGGPVVVVAALGAVLLHNTRVLDPYQPIAKGMLPHAGVSVADQKPMRVQVVGYDWKWLFIYPDLGIATLGELAFPAGRPLSLQMTSATVMQSLQIPALAGQMYVMGGMVTQLHLLADAPGHFLGQNTQYNGRGFHAQKFDAVAMTEKDFAAWTARVRGQGIEMGAAAQKAVARPGTLAELNLALQRSQPASAKASSPAPVYLSHVPADFFAQVVQTTCGVAMHTQAHDKEAP